MTLKKFSISFLTSAGFLAVIAVGVLSGNFEGVNTAEAATVSVTGYAWSDNIGWISFNCIDGGPDKNNICKNNDGTDKANYGVFYDDSTGQFSGYAWSDNIGWVYFGPDITGKISASSAPEIPKQWAKANATIIEGWAIAYRAVEQESQTLGGWDGWMKFDTGKSNSATINLTEGVTRGELHGYVWGGYVVGWVSLSCKEGSPLAGDICQTSSYAGNKSNYQVKANLPGSPLSVICAASPSSANVNEEVVFSSDVSGGESPYTYEWTGDWSSVVLGTESSLMQTFTTEGTKTATIKVTDSENKLATGNCSVVVSDATVRLDVYGAGNGSGTVSSGSSIKCNINGGSATGDCTENYALNTNVTLTAKADSGSKFVKWGIGECFNSTGTTCEVTMDAIKSVTAIFDCNGVCSTNDKTLTVIIEGKGTVSGPLTGNSCTDTTTPCSYPNLTTGASYTLTAKAPFGWAFTGWKEGDCSGIAKDCTVTMGDKDETVTATFSEVKIIEI